jgi:hypothetical protein
MKRDILGQLELSIIQTEMAIMCASDPNEKRNLSDKMKSLEARCDSVADKCANMSSVIGRLIQNPPQTLSLSSMVPLTPPGLLSRILPPRLLPLL